MRKTPLILQTDKYYQDVPGSRPGDWPGVSSWHLQQGGNRKKYRITTYCLIILFFIRLPLTYSQAQSNMAPLEAKEQARMASDSNPGIRNLHYRPEGNYFVRLLGQKLGGRRFNRALYGTHTGFRVEGGDLPEFALYMPGMGGNIRFILQKQTVTAAKGDPIGSAIWLLDADSIQTIFEGGHLRYIIRDRLLGKKGNLQLDLYALADADGAIFSFKGNEMEAGYSVTVVYGGASGDKFSRGGDVGADPESSFFFQSGNAAGNQYSFDKAGTFTLRYTAGKKETPPQFIQVSLPREVGYKVINGAVVEETVEDESTENAMAGSRRAITGDLMQLLQNLAKGGTNKDIKRDDQPREEIKNNRPATAVEQPALLASFPLSGKEPQYCIWMGMEGSDKANDIEQKAFRDKKLTFQAAKAAADSLADRVKIETPDPYINTLGGVLSTAADAIWEAPTYLHGAVAWRMRLPAWRGPYAADALGWHDRAALHFGSYARSQVQEPATGPVIFDSNRNHARQLEKMGTSMFSAGYIARNPDGDLRPHHYDMNLVYIDQLLQHFSYTGDTAYLRKMWPVIALSLAWENRNFDADKDGLYDAYACIWASDALEYNGGGVTHSTAYNYQANLMAAKLAEKLGLDGSPYQNRAARIKEAVNKGLWLPSKGVYAEYRDKFGKHNTHPSPGLWTLYQSIQSGLPDPFQAYQVLRYADQYMPRIPFKVAEIKEDTGFYLLSTTNWQPYTWSVNNVALAENLNMALGYWLGGQNEPAFKLWKSALMESMFLGASPGGFEQLSYYDARRGELYRDFADPIGIAAKSLMEGLFGLKPDGVKDTLIIEPGFPHQWPYARLKSPDMDFAFKREKNQSTYLIRPHYPRRMALQLRLKVQAAGIEKVLVNGHAAHFKFLPAVGHPVLQLDLPRSASYQITIKWSSQALPEIGGGANEDGNKRALSLQGAEMLALKDPQHILKDHQIQSDGHLIRLEYPPAVHSGTFFVQIKNENGNMHWWQPIDVQADKAPNQLLKKEYWFTGKIRASEPILIAPWFNDRVENIFKKQYGGPRSNTASLQLPLQGIGNWCYPTIQPVISDSGLRALAGNADRISVGDSISFYTPHIPHSNNIIFTSEWDCYPKEVKIPLRGQADGIALLMTGTTNPMQSQMENGAIIIEYEDHSMQKISLSNPETWWPVEQDYYSDNFAFALRQRPPVRIHLKSGRIFSGLAPAPVYRSIKGFSDRVIDGGAASVYQFSLNPNKKIKSLTLKATAQEVVIGLMGVALLNPRGAGQ